MHLKEKTLLQGGKYRIVRFISSGGFGCTYEAEHIMLGNRVAIKEFFVDDFCTRDDKTARVSITNINKQPLIDKLKKKFIEEARAVFQMHHEHIVRVIDIFEENNTAYYVMEYVNGQSLQDMVNANGTIPEQTALKYIRQVSDALRYVHSLNRLHLDVKPGNIMIDDNDNAILIDFGASKHYDDDTGENTSTLLGVNTKGYAPVEQMNSSFTTFSPATDIYALGATLYKLLTGNTPLPANSIASGETIKPLPDAINKNVRNAVDAAMRINKAERPQSIHQFLALLNGTNEQTILDTKSETTTEKADISPKKNNKNKPGKKKFTIKIVSISVVCLLIVACAAFVIINHYTGAKPHDFNSYMKAAKKGDAEAQYNLAQCYYNGDGVTQNYKEAVKWYRKSANQGYAAAQCGLGVCYYYGNGITESDDKAVELFRKAAEQGDANAQNNLGDYYHRQGVRVTIDDIWNIFGESAEKNFSVAAWWYRKAAEQGYAMAQFNLGLCYDSGQGVSQDYTEAVKWYRKAAEQGVAEAQYNLGRCYENGIGVIKDKSTAITWYTKAAEQGYEDAIEALSVSVDTIVVD